MSGQARRPEAVPDPEPSTGDGSSFEIDVESLTIGELAEIEELLGVGIERFKDPGQPKLRLVQAFAWIRLRRADPALTFDDVGRMSLAELDLGAGPSGE